MEEKDDAWKEGQALALLLGEECDEAVARKALAGIVREKFGRLSDVGEFLALAIDPATKSRFDGFKSYRRIKFESVGRGQKPQWTRNSIIGFHIAVCLQKHKKLDAALQEAVGQWGISLSTAKKIWKWFRAWRQDMEARWGGAQNGLAPDWPLDRAIFTAADVMVLEKLQDKITNQGGGSFQKRKAKVRK